MRILLKYCVLFILSSRVLQAQTWQSYTTANGLADNQIRPMTIDSAGNVWIGTRTKGIHKFDGVSFTPFARNSNLPGSGGSTGEVTGLGWFNGKLYIGMKSSLAAGGLWVDNGTTIQYIGDLAIYPSAGDIQKFFKAKDGTIYAGCAAGFFKRIADNNWTRIGYGFVKAIDQASDGTIVYSTFDSLYTYDGTAVTGLIKGMFYSVAIDKNDNLYTSDLNNIYRFNGSQLDTIVRNGYSKAITVDKYNKVWIPSGTAGSFGLKKYDPETGTITTYPYPGTLLLSSDMTSMAVMPNNTKVIGHYNSGLNTLLDTIASVSLTISPVRVNILVGKQQLFTAQNGVTPYQWGVMPNTLGTINNTGLFKAAKPGKGFVFVVSTGMTDTAKAEINSIDTIGFGVYPPINFTASKGKYQDKILLNWSSPGEFKEGFEDGIPSTWTLVTEPGKQTAFVQSGFQPRSGSKCIKFDIYSPGAPQTDWLITEKIRVTAEKPFLRVYFKTAFAVGNTYSSFMKLSTTTKQPSACTTVLKELTPAILQDSMMQWRFTVLDLTTYINQEVYLAYQCQGEDIIIYFDDIELIGIAGPTSIANAVKNYKVYRGSTAVDLKNTGTLVASPVKGTTTFTDSLMTPLTKYFYSVSAVFDSAGVDKESILAVPAFGIAYSQKDSIVVAGNSAVVPVIDGIINQPEYADAVKTIITKDGYNGDLYFKYSNNKLYIAVNSFNDPSLTTGDYVIFAFDKERNYLYTENTEGYFRVMKIAGGTELAFFPWTTLGFYNGMLNPAGFTGAVSDAGGNVQFELCIDLTTSLLSVTAPCKIGAYVGLYDVQQNIVSQWLEKLLAKEYSITGFPSITLPPACGVEQHSGVIAAYDLSQNYPNPFNPSTTISYQLPAESFVSLTVYDLLGKEVSALVHTRQKSGSYTVPFDGSKLASGVYFYTLRAGAYTSTKKLMLTK